MTITVFSLFLITACTDENPPVGRMPAVLAVNEKAPDFDFESLMDSEILNHKLSQYQGKVIYMDFWASWCLPCLKSMPLINKMRSELDQSDFEVIAVNLDLDPEKGREFILKYPVDYPVVRAVSENMFGLYQLNGLPTAFLIDKRGIIRFTYQGFKEHDILKIKQQVIYLQNNK
jgi:thiol-disulfide isomerase/thioredoxin